MIEGMHFASARLGEVFSENNGITQKINKGCDPSTKTVKVIAETVII